MYLYLLVLAAVYFTVLAPFAANAYLSAADHRLQQQRYALLNPQAD